jgi:hypothetical protein
MIEELGENLARYCGLDLESVRETTRTDGLAALERTYLESGEERSNLAYGFVTKRIQERRCDPNVTFRVPCVGPVVATSAMRPA